MVSLTISSPSFASHSKKRGRYRGGKRYLNRVFTETNNWQTAFKENKEKDCAFLSFHFFFAGSGGALHVLLVEESAFANCSILPSMAGNSWIKSWIPPNPLPYLEKENSPFIFIQTAKLSAETGIEPVTSRLWASWATKLLYSALEYQKLVDKKGWIQAFTMSRQKKYLLLL